MNKYLFSDKERAYLAPRLAALEKLQTQLNAILETIGVARDLDLTTQWSLAPDGSGLVAAENAKE